MSSTNDLNTYISDNNIEITKLKIDIDNYDKIIYQKKDNGNSVMSRLTSSNTKRFLLDNGDYTFDF